MVKRVNKAVEFRARFDSGIDKIGTFFGIPVIGMEIATRLLGGSNETGNAVFWTILIILFLIRSEVLK